MGSKVTALKMVSEGRTWPAETERVLGLDLYEQNHCDHWMLTFLYLTFCRSTFIRAPTPNKYDTGTKLQIYANVPATYTLQSPRYQKGTFWPVSLAKRTPHLMVPFCNPKFPSWGTLQMFTAIFAPLL
jgi:hypothetical protein